MKLYDLHTHTDMSDGDVSLEDLVAQEAAMGHVLGVSDHFFTCGIYSLGAIGRYLDALMPYDVYRGAEVNMEHDFSLPDELDSRLDYVIASVHSLPDGRGGLIPLSEYFCKRSGVISNYRKNYAPDLAKWYLAYTLRMMEKTFRDQRVDVLGHPTVNPACDELYGTRFLRDWEDAVISLCVKYGVAIEISGLWRAPGLELLTRAKNAGATFSMGSDCHRYTDIGVLDYPVMAIEELGLTEEDLFVPQRKLRGDA